LALQQAVEALKALQLVRHGSLLGLSNTLSQLVARCIQLNPSLSVFGLSATRVTATPTPPPRSYLYKKLVFAQPPLPRRIKWLPLLWPHLGLLDPPAANKKDWPAFWLTPLLLWSTRPPGPLRQLQCPQVLLPQPAPTAPVISYEDHGKIMYPPGVQGLIKVVMAFTNPLTDCPSLEEIREALLTIPELPPPHPPPPPLRLSTGPLDRTSSYLSSSPSRISNMRLSSSLSPLEMGSL